MVPQNYCHIGQKKKDGHARSNTSSTNSNLYQNLEKAAFKQRQQRNSANSRVGSINATHSSISKGKEFC
jgi:hypothetical protein